MNRLAIALLLLLLPAIAPLLFAQRAEPWRAHSFGSITPPTYLPLSVQEGRDPLHHDLLYQGTSGSGRIGFLRDGVRYGFRRGGQELIVGMTFEGVGSRSSVVPRGIDSNGVRITLIGSTAVSSSIMRYSEIHYRDIYDGIDIRYYGAEGALKYDCLVEPLADPARIRIRYDGVDRLEVDGAGDLEIVTSWGRLTERHPYVYQIVDGVEKRIEASFRLLDERSFDFRIGAYDRTLPLVIDPMILGWSTFVGGGDRDGIDADGYVDDMTVDEAGDVYCTGWYNQTFPTTPGVYSAAYQGGARDAYVFKLSGDGRRLLFSTFIGGSESDAAHAIALGSDGSIYVGGYTRSPNFPATPGAYDGTVHGESDCFLLKLSSDGDSLLYSSRFGGGRDDLITRIDVDGSGVVTATGTTLSADYPTTANAYDATLASSLATDLFITRLSADGESLLFSTLVGGTNEDFGADLVVEEDGETLVTGRTSSIEFPTTSGAYDETRNGSSDAFLLRLSADGSRLVYSTLFGGIGNDGALALAVGTDGRVIIAGYSESGNMPHTAGVFDTTLAGRRDGLVAIFEGNGSGLISAGYAGSGALEDEIQDVVVDDDGTLFIAGRTRSTDAITAVCPINGESRGLSGALDIYVMRVAGDLSTVMFADYIGGGNNDYGTRIALNPDRCRRELVVSITSHSANFPTTPDAYQPIKLNDADDQPTVMKIRPTITPGFRSTPICTTVSFTDTTSGTCIWGDPAWEPTTWLWDFGDGTTSTERNPTHQYADGGTYTVTMRVGCPRDSVTGTVTVTSMVSASPDRTICDGDSVGLFAIGGSDHRWSPADGLSCIDCTSPLAKPRSTTRYVVSTSGGCDDTVVVTVIPRVDVVASPDTTICVGQSVQLLAAGADDLLWSPAEDLSCTSCIAPIATPSRTTTYYVRSVGADERCSTSDSMTITVLDPRRMRSHMERGFLASPGDTVAVPMILDDPADASPMTSLRITLRYDSAMLRLVNVSPLASDSLFFGSLLAGWRMTVDTLRHGIFSALFVAPSIDDAITGGGRLLYLRFLTFVRPDAVPVTPWSDSASIPFEMVAVEHLCSDAVGDPGLVHLQLCGLAWRLIEAGAEKYSLSIGPSNPFSGSLSLDFTLGLDGPTTIELFDITGRKVATLLDGHLAEGRYSMTWDAADLPAGAYYLRFISGDWGQTSSVIKTE